MRTAYLVFIATTDCNLRCRYCYANGGDKKDYMQPDDAISYIKAFENQGATNFMIAFIGGEPILNFDLIKKVVSYTKRNNLKTTFRISTNGSAKNNAWKCLLDNKFKIALSMDGKPDVNSLTRDESPFLESRIEYLIKKNAKFHIRATLTEKNIGYFSEAIEWWAKKGVRVIHFEIVNPKKGRAVKNKISGLSDSSIKEYISEAIEIAKQNKIFLFNSAWMNLTDPNDHFCSSCHGEQFIILPDGSISACFSIQNTSEPLSKNFIIGKIVDSEIIWNAEAKDTLAQLSYKKIEGCQKCNVRRICAGGCPMRHLLETGSFYKNSKSYCEMKKILINLAKSALKVNNKYVLGYKYLTNQINK